MYFCFNANFVIWLSNSFYCWIYYYQNKIIYQMLPTVPFWLERACFYTSKCINGLIFLHINFFQLGSFVHFTAVCALLIKHIFEKRLVKAFNMVIKWSSWSMNWNILNKFFYPTLTWKHQNGMSGMSYSFVNVILDYRMCYLLSHSRFFILSLSDPLVNS